MRIFTATLIVFFSMVFAVQAGELKMGGGYMNGHSNANTRCINPGINIDLGYNYTLFESNPAELLGISFRAGGLLTYSNYETAYREYASEPMSDRRRDSSVTLLAMAKPGIRIWRIGLFGLIGAGPDYAQGDGLDGSYTYGGGVDVKFTERVSLEVSRRDVQRYDTGNYEYTSAAILIKF